MKEENHRLQEIVDKSDTLIKQLKQDTIDQRQKFEKNEIDLNSKIKDLS